jgi:nicotinate-nucleotide adenylyltransferase
MKERLSAIDDPLYLSLEQSVRERVGGERFLHSRRTAAVAIELCQRFSIDPFMGALAGIAHDIGRDESEENLIKAAEQAGRRLSPPEQENPILLHGWYGAGLVGRLFPAVPPEVLEAVEVHTAGRDGMGPLSMVLFCADYIEPGRKHINGEFRKGLRNKSLEAMALNIIDHHISYLRSAGRRIVKDTLLLYDTLRRGECEKERRTVE